MRRVDPTENQRMSDETRTGLSAHTPETPQGNDDALIIDKAAAIASLGSERLLLKVVDLFLANYSKRMQDIRQAVANHDSAGLVLAAHALKSAMCYFSAHAATEAALSLETMGRNGNLSHAQEVFSKLEVEIGRLTRGLSALLKEEKLRGS